MIQKALWRLALIRVMAMNIRTWYWRNVKMPTRELGEGDYGKQHVWLFLWEHSKVGVCPGSAEAWCHRKSNPTEFDITTVNEWPCKKLAFLLSACLFPHPPRSMASLPVWVSAVQIWSEGRTVLPKTGAPVTDKREMNWCVKGGVGRKTRAGKSWD